MQHLVIQPALNKSMTMLINNANLRHKLVNYNKCVFRDLFVCHSQRQSVLLLQLTFSG